MSRLDHNSAASFLAVAAMLAALGCDARDTAKPGDKPAAAVVPATESASGITPITADQVPATVTMAATNSKGWGKPFTLKSKNALIVTEAKKKVDGSDVSYVLMVTNKVDSFKVEVKEDGSIVSVQVK
jgi:hypothetical protein